MTVAASLVIASALSVALAQGPSDLPRLKLCRANVSPCQQELGLPLDGQADLDLVIAVPERFSTIRGWPLVAWHIRLKIGNPDIIGIATRPPDGAHVQERGTPALALAGLNPLLPGGSESLLLPEKGAYLRLRNHYDPATGLLEYGINVLAQPASEDPAPVPRLPRDSEILLGKVRVRGTAPGHTDIAADPHIPNPLEFLYLRRSRNLTAANLTASHPLATIEVGSEAELARLEGSIKTAAPRQGRVYPRSGDGIVLELWESGDAGNPRENDNTPVAVFREIQAHEVGEFFVADLRESMVPAGVYDLRLKIPGALTALARGREIDLGAASGQPLPKVVKVDFGPVIYGDLSGNNSINRSDLQKLRERFGESAARHSDGEYADLNGDGVIDAQDFSLLAINLGIKGE